MNVCWIWYKKYSLHEWSESDHTCINTANTNTHTQKEKQQCIVVVALNEDHSAMRWDQWDERVREKERQRQIGRCIVEVLID